MVRLPVRPSRRSSTRPSRRPRLSMTSLLRSASKSPIAVGAMPRPDFSNRVSPVSRCRAASCWLIADGV